MASKQTKSMIFLGLALGLILSTGSVYPLPAWSEESIDTPKEVSSSVDSSASASEVTLPKMSTRRTDETGDASLYIDTKEVIKLRSTVGGISPEARVALVQERLAAFLKQGGSPRDIKPGQEGEHVVIRTGEAVLVTIDSETAKKAKHTPKQLAFLWTNLTRQALGADPLTRDADSTASRGVSPLFSQLRQIPSAGLLLKGFASWYGPGFHGRRAANGERFNMNAMTAAHRTLPFNTLVKVTNTRNGKSTVVRITDRGPFAHGRVIDLSKAAAQAIGMVSSGTAPVNVEVLGGSR